LGFSPRHAQSAALVLSLLTGCVSPQFHLKFDDFFETVPDAKTLPRSEWQQKAKFDKHKEKRLHASVPTQGDNSQSRISGTCQQPAPADDPVDFDFMDSGGEQDPGESQEPSESDLPIQEEPPSAEQHQHPHATRRSALQRIPTHCLIENACAVLDDTGVVEDCETQEGAEDPIAFAACKSDPDTLNFEDAMGAKDSGAFKTAMMKEAKARTDNGHWEVWEKKDVPSDQDTLPSTWALRRKRRIISQEMRKYEAPLNAHGGVQKHGVNCWETCSPVVDWFSIRLCLILALIFSWTTQQIDFVLAFPQADVECDLFMQLL
jgi:hypothetical protein